MLSSYLLLILLFSVLLTSGADEPKVTFDDHKVIRIPVRNRQELDFLANLFYTNTTLDFWIEPVSLFQDVDIRVTPDQYQWIGQVFRERAIDFTVMIENVQELVEKQILGRKSSDVKEGNVGDIDYTQYHTYDEIIEWVQSLPTTYPNLVTLVNIGKTYQGRDILGVKITSNATPGPKRAIIFDGCIHAREWITTATVVYILGNILSLYGEDPVITALVDGLEIYVVPIINADGYTYTWSTDRMWRKTRTPNAGSSCIGTDPNRNWDYEWGGAGVSRDPCSDSYLGPAPFSEVEVKAIGLFIKDAGNIDGYINFHAYSQLWMSPWGYTDDLPADYQTQNDLSRRCANAIQIVYGTPYRYGPISTTIYPASGSSADYTYGAANVLYSYGVELRDTGNFGFLLPANQIVPSGRETIEAVKVWGLEILNSGKLRLEKN